jgi:hypothetical protein
MAGLAGACTALATNSQAASGDSSDAAVLNFALNLEYLEAEYYTFATTGASITALGVDVGSTLQPTGPVRVKTNSQVPFNNAAIEQYALEIAADERQHVHAIRATLRSIGQTAVARPSIDLQLSFSTLAQAAGLGATFDPFLNDLNFLLGAFIFEDVGVTAYKGAAPLINNKGILEAAAGILAAEAYHAGTIRTTLYALAAAGMPTIIPTVQKISNLRDALAGGNKDQGIVTAGESNLTPLDGSGIAFSRSTREVLNIVYGAQNASAGLFFPKGLNGAIK